MKLLIQKEKIQRKYKRFTRAGEVFDHYIIEDEFDYFVRREGSPYTIRDIMVRALCEDVYEARENA